MFILIVEYKDKIKIKDKKIKYAVLIVSADIPIS
jgi:hypothetical protein